MLLSEHLLWVISGNRLSIFHFLAVRHNLVDNYGGAAVNFRLVPGIEQDFGFIGASHTIFL
jgi:hypothetical protein